MKLTNIQLGVLTDSIYNKVQEKLATYKQTRPYQAILAQTKLDNHFDKISELIEAKQNLNKEREKISALEASISNAYTTLTGKPSYNMPVNIDTLKNKMNTLATEKVTDFPSKSQIQSDIVLSTIEGNADILSRLLTKYNLND